MAGGKETPRQKMIGMMYLVLTALLALQVSNAVLEKFAIIESTLTELVDAQNTQNAASLNAIIEEAGKSPRADVIKAKESAQKVRELTMSTIAEMKKLKQAMMAEAGHTEIDAGLINDHSSKVASMMISKSKPNGEKFEATLNNYVTEIRKLSGLSEKEFPTLAKAPKDHEI